MNKDVPVRNLYLGSNERYGWSKNVPISVNILTEVGVIPYKYIKKQGNYEFLN